MKKLYADWLKRKRQAKMDKLSTRIVQITHTINNIDGEIWPEMLLAFEEERTRLAWKRSDLQLKLNEGK